GRSADPTGGPYWQQVATVPAGLSAVAEGILTSVEADQRLLNQYYAEFLDRSADPLGEEAWLAALQGGLTTPTSVAEGFLASDEFYALASGGPVSISTAGAGGRGGNGGMATAGGSLRADSGAGSISFSGTLNFNGGYGGGGGAGGNGGDGVAASMRGG